MQGYNGIAIRMLANQKLNKHGTDILKDPHQYKSIVGALQYVTLTCPEISYIVNN